MRGMRSLLPSSTRRDRNWGRNSSPSAGTPLPLPAILSLPFGSTDGTGANFDGAITGIQANTQWSITEAWDGILRDVAPKCYGIRGSRIETNVAQYSNDFTNPIWDHGTDCTVASTTVLAPDGTNTASFIRESTGAFAVWPRSDQSISQTRFPANMQAILLAHVQPAGRSWAYCLVAFNNVNAYLEFWVNLDTGELGTVGGNLATRQFNITRNPSNGWVEIACSVVGPVTISPAQNAIISVCGTTGNGVKGGWTGDGVSGINQWEIGLYPFIYGYVPNVIRTTNAPLTVCYDTAPDGSQLRPFYAFDGGMRYNVFRPTELARSRVFNVGDCIEAVASDGIRRYYQMKSAITSVGAELCSDPNMDNSSAWVRGGATIVAGGEIQCTNAPTGFGNMGYGTSLSPLVPGQDYIVMSDITSISLGSLLFSIGDNGPSTPTGVELLKAGLYGNIMQQADVGDNLFRLYISNTQVTTARCTGFSVKPITLSAATTGTTGATSPVFPTSGVVADGGVLWEAVGYATIIGLELSPVNTNHPEGILFQLDATNNALTTGMVIGADIFPDSVQIVDTWLIGQPATALGGGFQTDRISLNSALQNRLGNIGKLPGSFTRTINRFNATNLILYNDGAMFTGAGDSPLVISGQPMYVGADSVAVQFTGCILNFIIVPNGAINDTNATARSRFDLKPFVALNADNNSYQTDV